MLVTALLCFRLREGDGAVSAAAAPLRLAAERGPAILWPAGSRRLPAALLPLGRRQTPAQKQLDLT